MANQNYISATTELVPGGKQEGAMVSDSERNLAIATLLSGLDKDSILKALKVSTQGQLEATIVPGDEKFTYFAPVTQADWAADNGATYNSGSVNEIKYILSFSKTSNPGDMVWKTTFYYEYSSIPKFISRSREELVELPVNIHALFQTI